MKRLVLMAGLLAMQGCTSLPAYQAYPGAAAAAERAELLGSRRTGSCEGNPLIVFNGVDGKRTFRGFWSNGYDTFCAHPSSVLLLPGEHTINVIYAHGGSPMVVSFCFVAESGKTYRAEPTIAGYDVTFFAVDVHAASRTTAATCGGP